MQSVNLKQISISIFFLLLLHFVLGFFSVSISLDDSTCIATKRNYKANKQHQAAVMLSNAHNIASEDGPK